MNVCLSSHICSDSGSDTVVLVNSAAALKCNGYRLESLLAQHLNKGSEHRRGAWYVNVHGSVH